MLITAGIAGEAFEEIRLIGGLVPAAYRAQYGFVPSLYKRTSYLSTVSQLLSTGDINRKIDESGKVYLQLTSAGRTKLQRRFPLFFKAGKWDGFFMIVIFDIPEKEKNTREFIRRKIAELGFGMLQESVWINPYHFEDDMREFLELNSLADKVFVLRATKLWVGDIREIASKVWNLDKINSSYLKVVKWMNKAQGVGKGKKQKLASRAHRLYFDTLVGDPLLPKELLPADWARAEAAKALGKAV